MRKGGRNHEELGGVAPERRQTDINGLVAANERGDPRRDGPEQDGYQTPAPERGEGRPNTSLEVASSRGSCVRNVWQIGVGVLGALRARRGLVLGGALGRRLVFVFVLLAALGALTLALLGACRSGVGPVLRGRRPRRLVCVARCPCFRLRGDRTCSRISVSSLAPPSRTCPPTFAEVNYIIGTVVA